ncbi:MAG: dephospho-CoA kinase [Parachlamydiales bacterium]
MLSLRKVAVTGGLACGKSSVCLFLKELGAYTVSADQVVHQLLSPRAEIGKRVVQLLGSDIVESGRLVREKIAERVFGNPQLLRELEALIHPAVASKIDEHYEEAKADNAPLFVAEVPLLFEVGMEGQFDRTVAVISELHLARGRMDTDAFFAERTRRQLPNEEKAQRADHVLHNNGSLAELKVATQHLYNQLLED